MLLALFYLLFCTGAIAASRTDVPTRMSPPMICERAGLIAINFSEGPVQDATNKILDEAADLGVKLTFSFTVNNIVRGNVANVYRRAKKEGHTVALRLSPGEDYEIMSEDEIEKSINKQLIDVDKRCGCKVKFATPEMTNETVDSYLYSMMFNKGVLLLGYSFCPYDYDCEDDPEKPMRNFDAILESSDPKHDSYIILMHDQSGIAYLREIVEIGENHGYKFVNMDECLKGYKNSIQDDVLGVFSSRSGAESIFTMLPLFFLISRLW